MAKILTNNLDDVGGRVGESRKLGLSLLAGLAFGNDNWLHPHQQYSCTQFIISSYVKPFCWALSQSMKDIGMLRLRFRLAPDTLHLWLGIISCLLSDQLYIFFKYLKCSYVRTSWFRWPENFHIDLFQSRNNFVFNFNKYIKSCYLAQHSPNHARSNK